MTTTLERPAAPARERAPAGGGRLSSRARGRLAVGVLVVAVGVLVNLAIYRGLNHRSPVLELARDVPAGGQLSAADFRTVAIGSDGGFRAVPAGELGSVVGSYAKVRLVAGTLLAREALQTVPLVAAGAAVVAVTVPSGEVPIGLRERSRVRVVIVADAATAATPTATAVDGLVVGLPSQASTAGQVSVSIELAASDASTVAGAQKARLVLLDPGATG